MPTGYTAKLAGHGQSFEEFAMTCARNFGALISMRDDPMDAPVPERFEPSDYYSEALQQCQTELERLRAMTDEEKIAYGETRKAEALKSLREGKAANEAQNSRLRLMLDKVSQWEPPTPGHFGLKSFMREQIEVSMDDLGWWDKSIGETEAKAPMDFYALAVNKQENDIPYYETEQRKEIDGAKARTAWVQQLRNSLQGVE